jgi:hypothetical protein
MTKNIVFVVVETYFNGRSGDSTRVVCIYSTREKAEAFVENKADEWNSSIHGSSYEIEEIVVDEG